MSRQDDKVLLNVILQKKINSYMGDAFFLNMILAYENMLPWFYEHYIQLIFTTQKKVKYINKNETFIDFFGGWTEPREVLKCRKFDRDVVVDIDIISFIEKQIHDGYYITTYLDEYYTIGEEFGHFCHDISIYGYDKNYKEFYVIGFDQKANYKQYKISYDVFQKAFKAGLQLSEKYNSLEGRNYILGISPDFDGKKRYKIRVDTLKLYLYEYLNGIHSIDRIEIKDEDYDIYMLPNTVYGIDVYDAICEYLDSIIGMEKDIDYRIFHALYEHKKLMEERMSYLADVMKYPISEEDLTALKYLVNITNQYRFVVIKHNIRYKADTIEKLKRFLLEVKEVEWRVLSSVYKKICLEKES